MCIVKEIQTHVFDTSKIKVGMAIEVKDNSEEYDCLMDGKYLVYSVNNNNLQILSYKSGLYTLDAYDCVSRLPSDVPPKYEIRILE